MEKPSQALTRKSNLTDLYVAISAWVQMPGNRSDTSGILSGSQPLELSATWII